MPSLYTTAQIRCAELHAQAGLEPLALMYRAAHAISDACASEARTLSPNAPIVALVGPGNNGGDALLAAIQLRGRGFNAQALLLQPEAGGSPDAAAARSAARKANLPFLSSFPDASGGQALFIDGLFGIGLSRPIERRAAQWVTALNALASPVIAIDVPSGINADTGAVVGDKSGVAVRARRTLTFLGDKPGLRTGPGRAHAGEVQVESLGVAADSASGTLVTEPEGRMLAAPLGAQRCSRRWAPSGAALERCPSDRPMAGAPIPRSILNSWHYPPRQRPPGPVTPGSLAVEWARAREPSPSCVG